jgi:hypothetical protein
MKSWLIALTTVLAFSVCGWAAETKNAPATAPSKSAAPAPSRKKRLEDYQTLMSMSIFSKDRNSRGDRGGQPAPPRPDKLLVLTGIAQEDERVVAFFENVQSGKVIKAEASQSVGEGKVIEVTIDHVKYEREGASFDIAVGRNLLGEPSAIARLAATNRGGAGSTSDSTPGGSSSPVAASSSSSSTSDGGDVASTLEKLKQKRLKEGGGK